MWHDIVRTIREYFTVISFDMCIVIHRFGNISWKISCDLTQLSKVTVMFNNEESCYGLNHEINKKTSENIHRRSYKKGCDLFLLRLFLAFVIRSEFICHCNVLFWSSNRYNCPDNAHVLAFTPWKKYLQPINILIQFNCLHIDPKWTANDNIV